MNVPLTGHHGQDSDKSLQDVNMFLKSTACGPPIRHSISPHEAHAKTCHMVTITRCCTTASGTAHL